jgi:UDP-arabinose 4-epimerase
MTTILVTGGAGYIGSHACKALAKAGYLPVAYDNLSFGHDWAAKWGPLERGDILHRARLDEVFKKYTPSAVMHFAAFAYVGESVTNPGKYYRNNVVGSLTLLEAMRDHAVDTMIFSSTCATYGIPDGVPIREDAAQRPINPYGASKLMVERMIQDFAAAHPLKFAMLRYFNASGADPDNQIGEDHNPETHLIPLVLDAALGRRPSITVFGSDYATPDGTCIRDYVHVSDLASAHVCALEALKAGRPSSAYNLGNGLGASVNEVIETAQRVTGLTIPVVRGERRPGDPPVLITDGTKVREELGWTPAITDLAQIIGTAWAWHQRQHPASRS